MTTVAFTPDPALGYTFLPIYCDHCFCEVDIDDRHEICCNCGSRRKPMVAEAPMSVPLSITVDSRSLIDQVGVEVDGWALTLGEWTERIDGRFVITLPVNLDYS